MADLSSLSMRIEMKRWTRVAVPVLRYLLMPVGLLSPRAAGRLADLFAPAIARWGVRYEPLRGRPQ